MNFSIFVDIYDLLKYYNCDFLPQFMINLKILFKRHYLYL